MESAKDGAQWLRLHLHGVDFILLLFLLLLQYPLWFGAGSWWSVATLHQQVVQKAAVVQQLEARNDKLAAQVKSLQQGQGAVAGLARRNLGMVSPGEIFVWVVPPKADTRIN